MSDLLVAFLDAIDERLLDYLDQDEELRLDTVERLWLYTEALLDGSITPAVIEEDWSDWFDLVAAFRTAYAPQWLADLEEAAPFRRVIRDETRLVRADRAYLLALTSLLDMHHKTRKPNE